MNHLICQAIQNRNLLRLVYHWGYRLVEPHAYGINKNGHELLRCYQVGGASESDQPKGWKLFRVDEIHQLHGTEENFSGPRLGYNRNDKALDRQIYCQL